MQTQLPAIDAQDYTDELYELSLDIDGLLDRVGYKDEASYMEAVRSKILALADKFQHIET